MELKKCESCGKVFFGDRSYRLCPICTVAQKGQEAAQRRLAAQKVRPASGSTLAAAR